MSYEKSDRYQKAFTLPTVVVASMVMIVSLLLSLQLVASSSASMRSIYYNQIVREAAKTGLLRAEQCLEDNGNVALWSDSNPLQPWTNCAGVGSKSSCESNSSCYVLFGNNVRTYYTIRAPDSGGGGGAHSIASVGTVDFVRNSSSIVYRSYESSYVARVGAAAGVKDVYFGYLADEYDLHPFFLTQTSSGHLQGIGYNGRGQLATGNLNSTSVPVDYLGLPSGLTVKNVFTQFKSGDSATLVLMSDDKLYVAGDNSNGNLGKPTSINYLTTAQKYKLGSGSYDYPVKVALSAEGRTYVVSDSGRLYSTGKCMAVGRPDEGSGSCSSPNHVASLPTPTSNSSTQVKQVAIDGVHNYLIMEGGQLYGWDSDGNNLCGLLGSNSRKPLRIGNFGNAGQPKVVKIDTDGIGLFALLDNGRLLSGGCNGYGHLASKKMGVRTHQDRYGTARCIDVLGSSSTNGTALRYSSCNRGNAQHWSFDEDYKIRNSSLSSEVCIDLSGGLKQNNRAVQVWQCSPGSNSSQEWVYYSDSSIRLKSDPNWCLSRNIGPGSPALTNGTRIVLWGCNGNDAQRWDFPSIPSMEPVNLPSSYVVKDFIADYGSLFVLVDTDGDDVSDRIYAAGINHVGQLGGGSGYGEIQESRPRFAQFDLPSSVKPIALAHAAHAVWSPHWLLTANTLAITERVSDTSIKEVYGAGTNTYGQLGTGITSSYESTPQKMMTIKNAISAKTGADMSVVLTSDGLVYTTGRNNYGQLGDGTTTNSSVPSARQYVNPLPLIIY